jgi:hypothetical protein
MLDALLTVRCLTGEPVGTWSKDITIKPVVSTFGRQTTHGYFRTNPESHDGKRVLFSLPLIRSATWVKSAGLSVQQERRRNWLKTCTRRMLIASHACSGFPAASA